LEKPKSIFETQISRQSEPESFLLPLRRFRSTTATAAITTTTTTAIIAMNISFGKRAHSDFISLMEASKIGNFLLKSRALFTFFHAFTML
jgi:hypothetical protein